MDANKAIEILYEHKERLYKIREHAYEDWKVMTLSYIKEFFGETSLQYRKAESLDLSKSKVAADNLLSGCIQVIRDVGLHSDLRDKALASPNIERASKTRPANLIRSVLEIAAWIIGIVTGLIVIYEFFIKRN